jgi:hypothetical protein
MFATGKAKAPKTRMLGIERLESRALLSISPFGLHGFGGFGGSGYGSGGYSSSGSTQVAGEISISVNYKTQVGVAATVQLTALDTTGRFDRSFDDTVKLTTTDSGATIPATVTFVNGTATVSVTFATIGQQTITATDSTTSSIVGTATTTVTAAPVASQYYFSLKPTVQSGTATTIQVEALDANGNLVRSYDGTATITSSDSAATLPSPATVTFKNGYASFSVTFGTAGTESITLKDNTTSTLTGTVSTTVVAPAVASQYSISLKSVVQNGSAVTVELYAIDSTGHIVQTYDGTATVTSTDTKATLPTSAVTFKNGVASFQVTFATSGIESLTITDVAKVLPTATASTDVVTSTRPSSGTGGTGPGPGTNPSPNPGSTSSNWSGYAAETNLDSPTNDSVTAVTGTWKVPTVSGSGTAYSSVWVGIDGYSSSSVEQIGTEQDVVNGQAEYSVWYEMYPSGSVTISTMTIKPGDSITASVQYVSSGTYAGKFELTITDTSETSDSFTTYQSGGSAERSSAEWIVEAPSSGRGILPLANFGSVQFTGATATINGVTGAIDNAAWQSTAINMGGYSSLSASTGTLTDTSSTSAFTVTYVASNSSNSTSSARSYFRSSALHEKIVPVPSSLTSSQSSNNHSLRDLVLKTFEYLPS